MIFIKILYLIFPVFLGGIARVFSQKISEKNNLNYPIDFGIQIGNKPLFGRTKTWVGVALSGLVIIVVVLLQFFLHQFEIFKQLSLVNYSSVNLFFLSTALTLGYNFGELPFSFIKRRFNIAPSFIPRGKIGFLFLASDQLDSVIGATIGLNLIVAQSLTTNLAILAVGIIIHGFIDSLLYAVGIKRLRYK